MCPVRQDYYLLYDYVDILYITIFEAFQLEALKCYLIYIYIYIYILLPIFNSDETVMSRENSKNFTYAFYKSGALHLTCCY
jgi:hypothetical protein